MEAHFDTLGGGQNLGRQPKILGGSQKSWAVDENWLTQRISI